MSRFFITSIVIALAFIITATISPALAALPGQIMVDPTTTNPNRLSWFVYNRDDNSDGKLDPHFMCAPGDPEGFLYRGSRNSDGTRNGDQMVLINKIKSNSVNGTPANGIYMQIVRSHGGDAKSDFTQNPFEDSDPTKGLDNDILNQWDTWFTEMDNAGITIYLFFWDDGARVTNWGDTYSENQFYTEIVNRFKGYKNLIWVFAEEYSERWSSGEVSNRATTIMGADNNKHPFAVHKLRDLAFNDFANDPNVDQFSIQYKVTGNDQNHAAMVEAWNNAQGRYNLNLAEPQNINPDSSNRTIFRQRNWAVGMGGAYIMNIEWNIDNTPDGHLRDCAGMVNFMEQTSFNEMAPNDGLASGDTDYVLASPGSSYIAYTSNYNSGIGLQGMTSDTYDFLWYDILNDNYVAQTNVSVGSGNQQWSRPSGISGSEVAVYLTNGTIGPPPTDGPSPSPTSGVNQPPVAHNTTVSTKPDQQVYIQLSFTDPDGPGPYDYTITQFPQHGSLTGSDNDRYYTPNPGFTGTDTFSWMVNDSLLDSNIATVTILVGQSLISNLVVNDTANDQNWSIQSNLQTGISQYGDRNYTFSTIPPYLLGSDWIKTANLSRDYESYPLATFNLGASATVYIAHDDRITSKPSWLSSWTDTGDNLTNSEPVTFSLYTKDFSPGSVSLGPNSNDGVDRAMYSIIIDTGSYTSPDQDGDGDVDFLDKIKALLSFPFSTIFDFNRIVAAIGFSTQPTNPPASPTQPANSPTPVPTIPPGSGISPTKIGTGAYPAITVDSAGDVHLAYARDGTLWYRKFTASSGSWGSEQNTGVAQHASYRNDPDIVTDSQNRPHVLGGTGNGGGQYAYFNGSSWVQIGSFNRDTALTIDNQDNVYVVERGGQSGGYIGVSKRTSGAGSFTQLPDPSVNAENDHVYTDIAANPADNSVHIVYRHGIPTKCASTHSSNGGSSWSTGGLSGDDTEAPGITAASSGNVYAICGAGGTYQLSGTNSWSSIGQAVNAASRHLPNLSTDSSGNLFAASFGGKYNTRIGSSWTGEKTVSGISSAAKGFMRIAGATNGQYAYAIWEEGNSNPVNDNTADNFDLVFATISSAGVVGDQ